MGWDGWVGGWVDGMDATTNTVNALNSLVLKTGTGGALSLSLTGDGRGTSILVPLLPSPQDGLTTTD